MEIRPRSAGWCGGRLGGAFCILFGFLLFFAHHQLFICNFVTVHHSLTHSPSNSHSSVTRAPPPHLFSFRSPSLLLQSAVTHTMSSGNGSSLFWTTINFSKLCIGSGVLALPFAAMQGGLLMTPLGLFCVGAWNVISCRLMIGTDVERCGLYLTKDDDTI